MSEPIPADRPRVWKTPPNVALCAEDDIAEPGARSFVLQIGEAYFHGFVVRKDGQVAGWVDRCPHAGFPLAVELDRYLTPRFKAHENDFLWLMNYADALDQNQQADRAWRLRRHLLSREWQSAREGQGGRAGHAGQKKSSFHEGLRKSEGALGAALGRITRA